MNPNSVKEILKIASTKLVEQQSLINEQSAKLAAFENRQAAEKLADQMINSGHIDFSDREEKIAELLTRPEDMDVVGKALELASNPSSFKLASLSTRETTNGARQRLESYLLSGD